MDYGLSTSPSARLHSRYSRSRLPVRRCPVNGNQSGRVPTSIARPKVQRRFDLLPSVQPSVPKSKRRDDSMLTAFFSQPNVMVPRLLRCTAACLLALCLAGVGRAQTAPRLLEVQLADTTHVGLPIHWDDQFALLLKPTGSMLELETNQVVNHRILNDLFVPQPLTSARSALQSELGNNYETATIGPYVLAAPRGHVERWRERFRVLMAGYRRYFETRGWQLRNPDFPLCVLILPSKAEFDRYCQQQLGRSMPNLMGYYFPKTNRCVLFEVATAGQVTDWTETERTIVHEAVHQLAYNTGIHERLADNPQWFVEGLASMFEEPAVFDSRLASRTMEGRMNQQQLGYLRPMLSDASQLESRLRSLVTSNDMFKRDATSAYALSWGLTFYLAERMSNQYSSYSQRMAQLPKLQNYSAADRARDFTRGFEADLSLIAIQLQRFYSK